MKRKVGWMRKRFNLSVFQFDWILISDKVGKAFSFFINDESSIPLYDIRASEPDHCLFPSRSFKISLPIMAFQASLPQWNETKKLLKIEEKKTQQKKYTEKIKTIFSQCQ